jgi:hypothetical protein
MKITKTKLKELIREELLNEAISEGKLEWKINKKVSPANVKIIGLQSWIPEMEYVSGNYVIVKLNPKFYDGYMMIDNGKLVWSKRKTIATEHKLENAKKYFENK